MKKKQIKKKFKAITGSKIFLIAFFVLDTAMLFLLTYRIIQLTVQKTAETISQQIISEQIIHKDKAEKIIEEMDVTLQSLETDLPLLKKKTVLTLEKKEEIFEQIKLLEKNAIQIQREFWEYSNDFSLQLYPGRAKTIDNYFHKTQDLPLKAGRFTRGMEEILYSPNFSRDSYELAKRAQYDLRWQIEEIKNSP
ncbi:MAG TPA: hypothetical protein PLK35_02090 [Candidatus Moranbacteria bacterium]|nr:hypothetical protein [Candidatus Moranbacteria bacterium]